MIRNKLMVLAAASAFAAIGTQAGSASYDFNSAPPADLNFVGNAEWRDTGGVNGSGYMALFDSKNSQHASVLIPDFDKGLVVKAFTFEVDLRVGNGTGNGGRPADGFSINYSHSDDPVVLDLQQEPPVDNINNFHLGGAPESGTATGLAICFDTWQGNTQPDGGADLEGIMIKVNGTVLNVNGQRGIPMPTRNGACDDATSMQTGPYNGLDDGVPDGLCWAHLKVVVEEDGKLTVTWKGKVIADHIQTGFAPAPGRIVFAGRTGGANENTHIDNLVITTVPADKAVISAPAGTPTGFTVTVADSGPSVFDATAAGAIVDFKLNGQAISATASEKNNGITTLTYANQAVPIAPGSANTVSLTIKDTRGVTSSKDGSFTGVNYATIPATWAATGVDKTKPGFVERMYQVDYTDDQGNTHGTEAANNGVLVATGERMLHGDLGANTADQSLFTGPGGTYVESNVINYNAFSGNQGAFADDGTVAGALASPNLPGLPGTATREGGNDDCTMEIITYIEFPTAGAYKLVFNSDDGFRTTSAANPKEVLNSAIVSQYDNGRGASDTVDWIYVPTAGIYPFRSIWMEGGGGANMEWAAINQAGVKALINDPTAVGALKAYAVNNGAEPAAVTYVDPPRNSGRRVPAGYPLTYEITDGTAAISGITLTVNGTAVVPTVTKSGKVSKVVYSGLLPANQNVTAVLTFNDAGKTYTGTHTFAVGGGVEVPPSMALKAGDVDKTKPGFLIKTVQHDIGLPNSTAMGEALVHGYWGKPNTADLTAFTGPGGSYVEESFLNYNGGSGAVGNFQGNWGYGELQMPGIPGSAPSNSGQDNYALEIRTVLDLAVGTYHFGVNSDDGFRLIIGDGKEAYTLPVVAGEFNGGRGADNNGFTQFSVKITKAGLYPFRMVFEEGGGGNNLEWFQITKNWLPDQFGKILVNDVNATPAGLKAYQYPINSTGPTWVKSIAPGRMSLDTAGSTGRAGPDATVKLVLGDGSTPVDTASVTMSINGTPVTPSVTKAGTETTVSYKPAGGFAAGSVNNVSVTFGDRTVGWAFKVGLPATPTFWIEAADYDYNGGQSKPEASVMPYTGGAYAGLAGTTGTDYKGPFDGDNPYYRHPNTQGVPFSFADDRDRGNGEVAVNFRVGWMGSSQWFNYTRTIPAGKYNVYAALSSGTAGDHISGNLAKVVGGTETVLGVFDSTAAGGWGNNALLPLKAAAADTTPLTLDLGGTTTLRYNDRGGDWDFMLLVPALAAPPQFTSIKLNADGSVTVEWTGGGTLQAGATVVGPWQDVTGATSPFTFAPSAAQLFGRVRQ